MAICDYLAPDGEKSILAQALEQKYGPDKTAQLWNFARANMDRFSEFDVHGEPTISNLEQHLRGNQNESSIKPIFDSNDKINYTNLKEQADQIESGTARIDTFTPAEEKGRLEGGRTNVEASLLLRANAPTVEQANSEWQEKQLTDYAKQTGQWFEPTSFTSDKYVKEGDEAKVYQSGKGTKSSRLQKT